MDWSRFATRLLYDIDIVDVPISILCHIPWRASLANKLALLAVLFLLHFASIETGILDPVRWRWDETT